MLSLLPVGTISSWLATGYVLCAFAFAWVMRHDLGAWDLPFLLKTFGTVLTAFTAVIVSIGYAGWRWLWRWIPILASIYPDLNGKWDLTISWNRQDQGGKVVAKAVIKQNFFRISMEVEAPDSESRTLSAVPKKDAESGRAALHYIYLVTPHAKQGKSSAPYHGAAILAVSGEALQNLAGNYWTSHQSVGRLSLTRGDGPAA